MTDRDRIATSRVVIGGISTRTLEVDGAGPPILLLHGFSDSADSWRPTLRRLAEIGRRAVAVDLPGSGWASPLGRPPVAALDHFVESFLALHAPTAILVGNSLGGLVALRAAERDDLPLAGVVGVSPAGLRYGRWLTLLAAFNPLLDLAMPVLARLPVPRRLVRIYAELLYEAVLSQGQADRELVRLYASHWTGVAGGARLWRDLRALDHDRQAVVRPAAITRPILLIWGQRDGVTPVGAAHSFLEQVPAAELVVLPGCGHSPQIQQPERVADLIDSFATVHGAAHPNRPPTRHRPFPVLVPSRHAHL
jgi:pimeloyl-ACP methyl ester carboxylesterase